MKKRYRTLLKYLVGLIVVILLTFIPTLNLKTKNMITIQNEHFIIYYEKRDENAAIDISSRLEKDYNLVFNSINISPDYKTEVYIYSNFNKCLVKYYPLLYF